MFPCLMYIMYMSLCKANGPTAKTVPEGDRELLWESLREKQAAQLDRLKRGESRYELDELFIPYYNLTLIIFASAY